MGHEWDSSKHKRGGPQTLLRRKLSPAAVAAWEAAFGAAWRWLPAREKEAYIPGDAVLGSHHEWSREPSLCRAVPCYLCGADFDSKEELVKHWRYNHLSLPELEAQLAQGAHRVEAETHTRRFYDEYFCGPFDV